MAEPLTVSTDDLRFVSMKLSGSLNGDTLEALKAGVEAAKQSVKALALEKKGMLKVLFDITAFTGTYSVEAISLMKSLADHNRPYVARSAVFGGPDLARIAAQVTIELIAQPTIKLFKTKEEALEWLLR